MFEHSHCISCGRPFGQRKHVENEDIKYCSALCRKEKLNQRDIKLEKYILKRLQELSHTNICPSLISREFFLEGWRSNHQRTIKACRRLMLRQCLFITQKKKAVVDLNFKGPFRIQKKL